MAVLGLQFGIAAIVDFPLHEDFGLEFDFALKFVFLGAQVDDADAGGVVGAGGDGFVFGLVGCA